MDEQTRKIIEAFASMRASSEDLDVVSLARKVRTPEGVQKYDQPIGTIITKDMIEKAAKKAAEAASKTLHKEATGKSPSSATSTPGPALKYKPLSPKSAPSPFSPSGKAGAPDLGSLPGKQTSADIKQFFVSSTVNNPSQAGVGWAQKSDGTWVTQTYKDGKILTESALSKEQVNAIEAMAAKNLVHSVHIPDATPDDEPKSLAKQINEKLAAGQKTTDPDVSDLIQKLQAAAAAKKSKEAPQVSEKKTEAPKPKAAPEVKKPEADKPEISQSNDKTVEINGKQVKVGRYSRPKGFAKAFLIVHEDGKIEYENKNGERKKITATAFKKHQDLGMNKFLTSETGAIKKGDSYEDGKLVSSNDGKDTAPETPKVSPAIQAAKDAAAALKAKQEEKAKEDETPKLKEGQTLLNPKGSGHTYVANKEDAVYVLEDKSGKTQAEIGSFYVQHPDGSWTSVNMYSGVSKFTGEKKDQFENDIVDGVISPWSGHQSSNLKTKSIVIHSSYDNSKTKTYDVPEDSKVYAELKGTDDKSVSQAYVKNSDGTVDIFTMGGKSELKPNLVKYLDEDINSGTYQEWNPSGDKNGKVSEKEAMEVTTGGSSFKHPKGSKVYVPSIKKSWEDSAYAYIVYPDGTTYRQGKKTGLKKMEEPSAIQSLINEGSLVKWDKYSNDDPVLPKEDAGDFYVSIKGNKVSVVPKGTKVFATPGQDTTIKYVKTPDGVWHHVTSGGMTKAPSYLQKVLSSNEKNNLLEDVTSKDDKSYVSDVSANDDVQTKAEATADTPVEVTPSLPEPGKTVKISGMDIKPGKYSIGKGFAKAFLLVHPDGTAEYQNKKGDKKKLTAAAFKKNWDAGMNQYAGPLDVLAGPAETPAKPTNANGPKAGVYNFAPFDVKIDLDSPTTKFEIMDDGSVKTNTSSGTKTFGAEHGVSMFNGMAMDEFGNSVILPGSKAPEKVHFFAGTKSLTVEDLQKLRDDLVTTTATLSTVKEAAGDINVAAFIEYAKKHFPGNEPDKSRKAFIKAIDDMLHASNAKQAPKPSVAEPVPANKGIFTYDNHGFATLPEELSKMPNAWYWKPSDYNQYIKKISEHLGGAIGKTPSKLSTYGKSDWLEYFYNGKMDAIYILEKNSGIAVDANHPGAPGNSDTHKITWASAVPGELPAGQIPEGEWTFDVHDMSSEEVDNYLIAANMAYPEYLDSYYKKHWVIYHKAGNKSQTDSVSLQAKANHDKNPNSKLSNKPVFTEGLKPKKAWEKYYETGESVSYWPEQALKEYAKDHPDAVSKEQQAKPVYTWATSVENHIANKKAEEAAAAHAAYLESLKPKFTKASGTSVSGGHHEAMVLVDQFGKKWVYKPREDEDIFLADAEQGAHELAQKWGYKTARSFITEFDGRKGHVQEMFDAKRDLGGVSMSELTPSQVSDLAKEHLLDWALDNDDSWSANILELKNGSMVGIDKGRAFVAIGHWKGLSADSSAHVHMPLVYTELYNAIGTGTVSKEAADAAYFSVLKQARKMEKLPDDTVREILEKAFANRKNWKETGGPASKDEAIEAALNRKNSLVADMEKLWDKIYAKAGYDKPEAPQGVVSNPEDQDIHLGVTPAALEQAKANGSYGASVFFAGKEIEDSHVVLYHTKNKNGVDMMNGEMKIREESDAFKNVETWLKSNATEVGDPYSFTPGNMKQTLPNESDYFQKIIAGVKTISAHALDGQYNESTLNGMSWVKNTLKNYVDEYDDKMSNPTTQAQLVKQYKDPQAYLKMAQQYLGFIAKAEEHKANGTKSMPGEFTQFEWTPPKEDLSVPDPKAGQVKVELRKASSAKTKTPDGAPKFEEDGSLKHDAGYTTDGNPGSMYLVTLPTGETIEFRGNTTGTPVTSKGLTRFTFPAGADEAASMERIRAQMAEMGLKMDEATEDDLELYYWRHLAAIMDNRADSKKNPSAYNQSKSSDKYKAFHKARPVETANMSSAEEIEAWRNAFANITSRDQIDEFVGSGGHLPKFSRYHPKDTEKYAGQPFWERFDVTDEQAYSKQFPGSSFAEDVAAEYIVSTGGYLSTEARLRVLGMWKEGMSSTSDMSHGSSGFVFVRQNRDATSNTPNYNLMSVYFSPKILKRTHNYSYADDKYGEMNYKGDSAYFDFDSLTQHNGGTNEIMIKHSLSLLDDIEIVTFEDAEMRKRVIQALKDLGIDEIRGVPVEQRFVMRNKKDVMQAQKAVKEAWKK